MSKKKFPLQQVGLTTDGRPVYSGLFRFYETYGLPLDSVLSLFIEKGWVPDWMDFYLGALKSGMKHDRILSKLEEAISDSFGKGWSDTVLSTLNVAFRKAND